MKTLWLLRHAKASSDDPTLEDHERPLNPEGRAAALRIAEHLATRESAPSLVVCSSARRTVETFDCLTKIESWKPEVRITRELYLASGDALAAYLGALSNSVNAVLLIGHNPGIQELAFSLVRAGPASERTRLGRGFAPAALAEVALAVAHWSEVERGGTLESFLRPKDLA